MRGESTYNQVDALYKYACLYKHQIDRIEFETILKSSPFYPSLLSIYRSLEFCDVRTNVVRAKREDLYTLGRPCLLHIKELDSEYFLLTKCCNDKCIIYYDTHNSKYVESESKEQLSKWDGILIYTEQKEYYSKRSILTILAVLSTFLSCFHWDSFLLSANLWGLFLAYQLFLFENGIKTSLVDGVCRIGKSFDCNKVTHSKAARITGIPLSVLGSLYFSSIVLFLLISRLNGTIQTEIIGHLQMINIGCIPILGYSITKQYQLRTWCIICISIVSIILIETIVLIGGGYRSFYSLQLIILHLLCIVTSGLFIQLLLKTIAIYREYIYLHVQDLKIKRNPTTQQVLFKNAQILNQYDTSYISLGNALAPMVITTWISPFCSHCSELVKDMLKLYSQHKEDLEWRIYIPGKQSSDWNNNLIQHTLIAWYNNDKTLFIKALKEWFIHKRLLPIKTKDKQIPEQVRRNLEKQSRFTNEIGITSYPKIFINGLELPSVYTIKDIFYMIYDEESWKMLNKTRNNE